MAMTINIGTTMLSSMMLHPPLVCDQNTLNKIGIVVNSTTSSVPYDDLSR